MNVKELHREAMKYNDLALLAKKKNSLNKVKENYSKAFEFERKAFVLFNSQSNEEPTRSILIRSAANLAILSEQYREAEKLISIGLAGDVPDEFGNEFRDLLQQVNFHRHLEIKGIALNTNELQFSLSGNEVGHGLIRSDEFLSRIEVIERIAFRTADRLRKKPFNDKGRPQKSNVVNFEPYISVPRAASFAVTIRFGQSLTQPVFEGMDVQSMLIDDMLMNIRLINDENYKKLNQTIKDDSYRRNFIALTKELAPDGDRIKLVGLTTKRNNKIESVALVKSKNNFSLPAELEEDAVKATSKAIQIEGILSFADSKKSKVKLTDKKNKDFEIIVPKGLLSDIVKPYFEEMVIITGNQKGNKIELKEIKKTE